MFEILRKKIACAKELQNFILKCVATYYIFIKVGEYEHQIDGSGLAITTGEREYELGKNCTECETTLIDPNFGLYIFIEVSPKSGFKS